MGYENFVARVERLGGFDRRDDAERAIAAALEVLGERLADSEAHALARALPPRIAILLRRRGYDKPFDSDELVARVASKEKVGRGFALEHVEAVFGAVGEEITEEARMRLRKALPPAIASLFDVRAMPEVEVPPHPLRESERAFARTVAVGHPSSKHPVAAANPDRAQSDSVARAANPHGDTKLSSADGLTQEREAESLATGQPARR